MVPAMTGEFVSSFKKQFLKFNRSGVRCCRGSTAADGRAALERAGAITVPTLPLAGPNTGVPNIPDRDGCQGPWPFGPASEESDMASFDDLVRWHAGKARARGVRTPVVPFAHPA